MKLLWVLSHGFAAVRLIQHILDTFPSCVSIGEALLVTAGIVLYFGDMLAYTLAKGLLLGLLLFPMLFKFILQIWAHFASLINSEAHAAEERTVKGIDKSLVFYASLAVTLILMAPAWMQFVLDFDHWLSLFIAVTLSGLLEAYTAQLDNAFIPLVFYSLLCL
ncbi:hypothetical protein HHK36_018161 [Tetracentron sinense]|uniref:dolichol kinase n=1 Tax=Tetracentron sinense TaxID=13715 RepID=A0A834YYA2_TETSI|nr:hypothetical protein HHK36_018161 [Tetracentron sinense]